MAPGVYPDQIIARLIGFQLGVLAECNHARHIGPTTVVFSVIVPSMTASTDNTVLILWSNNVGKVATAIALHDAYMPNDLAILAGKAACSELALVPHNLAPYKVWEHSHQSHCGCSNSYTWPLVHCQS